MRCEFPQARASHPGQGNAQSHWLPWTPFSHQREKRVLFGALLEEQQVHEIVGEQEVALGKDALS